MKKAVTRVCTLIMITVLLAASFPSRMYAAEDNGDIGQEENFEEFDTIEFPEDINAGEGEEEFPEESSSEYDDGEMGNEGDIVIPDDAESAVFDDSELDIEDGEEVYSEDSPIYVDEELSGTDDYVDEDTSVTIGSEEEQDDELNAEQEEEEFNEPEGEQISEPAGESEEGTEEELIDEAEEEPEEVLTDEAEEEDQNDELNASSGRLSTSKNKLLIQKGSTSSFTLTVNDLRGSAYLQCTRSDSLPVTLRFDSYWSGMSIGLNVTATGLGSGYVIVYLKSSSTDAIMDTVYVNVSTYSSPSVSASASSVSMYAGESKNVTFTASGCGGGIYLRYGTTNSQNYSCSWGSWSGSSVPLTIRGNSEGSGYVTVYLFDSLTDTQLASTKISVKVNSKQSPKLTLSKSSVTVSKGSSDSVKVTVTNSSGTIRLSYGQTNSSAFSCKWGSWSGSTIPLTITGNAKGTGTVYIYLLDDYGQTLASTSFSVTVNENAKVTVSKSSVSIKTGATASVNVTVSGLSGKATVQYGTTNSSAYSCAWGSWSGSTIPLKITGKNKGSGKITVYLKDSNGNTLSTASISVTVTASASPGLSVSKTSVSVAAGKSTSVPVTITNGGSGLSLQFYVPKGSPFTCSWGQWSGYTNPLTINGTKGGSGTVTVYLRNSSTGAAIASAKISVTVTGAPATIKQLSYPFDNFGSIAPYSLCKKMFGNNEFARAVYRARISDGGNCFGFAATSGMFYKSGNGVTVSDFNSSKSWVYQLAKRDSSKSFSTNVQRFIEALQISQVSWMKRETSVSVSTLGSLISHVQSEKKNGKPVMVCVRGYVNGYRAGHAILAYDVQQVDSTHTRLLIYDSNHNQTTRYLDIYKNSSGSYKSWSYNLWSGLTWSSSNGELAYNSYDDYYKLWQNRGRLSVSNMNLFISNSRDFELFDVNDNVAAVVKNGELVESKDGVEQVLCYGVRPDGTSNPSVLYLPVELYTLKNTDKKIDNLDVQLVNEELGVQVMTSGDEVTMCADDSCNLSSVKLNSQGENNDYQIFLTSSRDGDPDCIEMSGASDGETISVMIENGDVQTLNANDAAVTVSETNGDGEDKYFAISVNAGMHGTIVSDKSNLATLGDERTYTITPEDGYDIEDVKVDGNSVGAVSSYTFTDIDANHEISATFRNNRPLPGKTTRGDMFNLANNVKVTWKEVSGAKYYKVYREGITDPKETQDEPVVVTTGLVGWDSAPGLTNGHAYRYRIVASLTGRGDPSGDSESSYSKVMYRLKTVVIRSVKNTAPGKVTVKYDRTESGDSYVLQYCERQDMVGAKTKVVLGAGNTSYVIGGLKKGKTYYISIRVRKKVDGIDYYTTFGVPKKVTISR